jgi:hypothetical protein
VTATMADRVRAALAAAPGRPWWRAADQCTNPNDYAYVRDEYGDATSGPRATPDLSWVKKHGSWHILNHGDHTLVPISEAPEPPRSGASLYAVRHTGQCLPPTGPKAST